MYGGKKEQISGLYTKYKNLTTAYETRLKEEKKKHLFDVNIKDKHEEEKQPDSCCSFFQKKKSSNEYDELALEELRPLIFETANKLYEASKCNEYT